MGLCVGIAGLRFGLSWARLFAAHPDVELSAICDTDPEKLANAAQHLGAVEQYAAFEDLLADGRIDAVGIFTPAPLHASQAAQALQAGKHVLCAVPAARTLDGAMRLVEAAAASPGVYMMAENWVYEPSIVRARELYRDGKLGRIYYAEAEYIHDLTHLLRDAAGRRTWRGSLPSLLYPTHGTGPYLHMTGDRFVEATAAAASGRPEFAGDYSAEWVQTALLRSESGALFRLTNSFRNIHGMSHFLSFYGDRGSAETGRFRDARRVCTYTLSGETEEQVVREVCRHPDDLPFPSDIRGGHSATSMQIILSFLDAVDRRQPPPVDLFLALDMTLPGIAAAAAVREKGWIEVPDPRAWTRETS